MLGEGCGGELRGGDDKVDLATRGTHTIILSKYKQNLIGF